MIRADCEAVNIGRRSNVQDGCVLHADPEYPCRIGDGVTIGHLAIVQCGHATAERARTLSVMKALRANLRWVDRAITKMDLGTYGTCDRCGAAIADERLQARPWSALCVRCSARSAP